MAIYETILTRQGDVTREFTFYDLLDLQRPLGRYLNNNDSRRFPLRVQHIRVPNTGDYQITMQLTMLQADGTKVWHNQWTGITQARPTGRLEQIFDALELGKIVRFRKGDTGNVPVRMLISMA